MRLTIINNSTLHCHEILFQHFVLIIVIYLGQQKLRKTEEEAVGGMKVLWTPSSEQRTCWPITIFKNDILFNKMISSGAIDRVFSVNREEQRKTKTMTAEIHQKLINN